MVTPLVQRTYWGNESICNLKAMQEKIDARGSRWEISRKELH